MAIHEEKIRSMGAGQAKTINAGAMGMVLDTLQRYQYIYPVQSTIREIASNAVDSIKEKNVARAILSGKALVEDYFIEREGEIYENSHFDHAYYDLKYLSYKDLVTIHYISGGPTASDKIVISDTGVGLGEGRLEGYFEMGYSTKRLSKLPLGKWGIGAKSPLSVGVDYYTIESTHNGRRYRFNIYAHSYDSIIPQYNLEKNKENNYIVFALGTDHEYKVYYEETNTKNGVTITIGAKKHHKKQYLDAVRSQLLYFSGIKFLVTEENGQTYEENFQAKILYEDEFIVLSDNNYYTKPHLLLNGVNYGYVDWQELELQDRTGNVGIKVAPEDIEVTPSREGVIWSEKTKAMVNQRFEDVQEIASKAIQEELKETDFWRWVKTCFSIGTKYSHNGNDIISRLSKIVDISELKPKYLPDPRIRFTPMGIFDGLTMRAVTLENESRQNKMSKYVKRKPLKVIGSHIQYPIFYVPQGEAASNRKDKWLLSMYPEGFVMLHEPDTLEHMRSSNAYSEEEIEWYRKALEYESGTSPRVRYDLMVASQDVGNYTAIEVPEDFRGTDLDEVKKSEKETTAEDAKVEKAAFVAAADRRKLEGKIVMHTPRLTGQPIDTGEDGVQKLFVYQKLEQKISEINDWEEAEIYYGTDADDETIQFAAAITRDRSPKNDMVNRAVRTSAETVSPITQNGIVREGWIDKKWYRLHAVQMRMQLGEKGDSRSVATDHSGYYCQHFYDNREIKLVKVAQANVKYVRDFKHIQEFFVSIRNNIISMSNLLIKWNTARLIQENLHKVAFLYNYAIFNEEYADKYQKLRYYITLHYNEIKEQSGNDYFGLNSATYNDLVSHLDNVQKFQEFVREFPTDTESITQLAEGLFGNKKLQDGMAVEPEIMDLLQDVLEYGKAVGDMLNWIPKLTGMDNYEYVYKPSAQSGRMTRGDIPATLEHEIKLYLEYKEVLNYGREEDQQLTSAGTEESYKDS